MRTRRIVAVCCVRPKPPRHIFIPVPLEQKTPSAMKTLELVARSLLQILLAVFAGALCVRLCTGCAYVKAMREEAKPSVVLALKEAYANGGAAAVSNRIESLVASGDLSSKQAARLREIAQGVYDRVVEKLEAECAKGAGD